MKKLFVYFWLSLISLAAFTQGIGPSITSAIQTVNQGQNRLVEYKIGLTNLDMFYTGSLNEWEKFVYDYDAIDLFCTFTSPSGKKFKVRGFFKKNFDFTEANDCQRDNAIYTSNSSGSLYQETDPNLINNPQSYYEKSGVFPSTYDPAGNFDGSGLGYGWYVRFSPEEYGLWSFSCQAKLTNPAFSLQANTNIQSGVFIVGQQQNPDDNFSYTRINTYSGHAFIPEKNDITFLTANITNDGYYNDHPYQKSFNMAPFLNPGGICFYNDVIRDGKEKGLNLIRISPNSACYGAGAMLATLQTFNSKFSRNIELLQDNLYRWDRIFEMGRENEVFFKVALLAFPMLADESQFNNPNNPFAEGLSGPCDFWNSSPSQPTTKILENYIKYMVARYGYSHAIHSWELIDEPENIESDFVNNVSCFSIPANSTNIKNWYASFGSLLKTEDLNRHLLTPGAFLGGFAQDYSPSINPLHFSIASQSHFDYIDRNEGLLGFTDLSVSTIGPVPPTSPCNTAILPGFGIKLTDIVEQRKKIFNNIKKPYNFNSFWTNFSGKFNYNGANHSIGILNNDYSDKKGAFYHDAMMFSYFGNTLGGASYFFGDRLFPNFMAYTDVWSSHYCFYNPGALIQYTLLKELNSGLFDYKNRYESLSTEIAGFNNEIGLSISCTPTHNLTSAEVHAIHRGFKEYMGWIKDDGTSITNYKNSCNSYFNPTTNPKSTTFPLALNGSSPKLVVKKSTDLIGATYRVKWYFPVYNSITDAFEYEWHQNTAFLEECPASTHATFTLPYVDNIFGEVLFHVEVESASDFDKTQNCNAKTDLILPVDYDGDGTEEILFINKCVKCDKVISLRNQANSELLGETDCDEIYKKWLDNDDIIVKGDFDYTRDGEELAFINTGSDKSEFAVMLRDLHYTYNHPKGLINLTTTGDFNFLNLGSGQPVSYFVGNVDDDLEDEIILLSTSASNGFAPLIFVIDPKNNEPVTKMIYFFPDYADFVSNSIDKKNYMLGDVNGDGKKDLVCRNPYSQNRNAILAYDIYNQTTINLQNHGVYQFLQGWLDQCDRILIGNVTGGPEEELVLINSENGGSSGQGAVLVYNAATNSILFGTSTVSVFSNFFDSEDNIYLADADGDGYKDLMLANKNNYAPNGKGVRSYKLNGTPGFICSYDNGPMGNNHSGWMDLNDLAVPIKSNGIEKFLFVNRPFQSQYLFRAYDLSSSSIIVPTGYLQTASDAIFLNGAYTYNCQNISKENNYFISQSSIAVSDDEGQLGDKNSPDAETLLKGNQNESDRLNNLNNTTTDRFTFFPNPVNHSKGITVNFELTSEIVNARLTDAFGRTILQFDQLNGKEKGNYYLPFDLVSGIYYLKVELNTGKTIVEKVVILQ